MAWWLVAAALELVKGIFGFIKDAFKFVWDALVSFMTWMVYSAPPAVRLMMFVVIFFFIGGFLINNTLGATHICDSQGTLYSTDFVSAMEYKVKDAFFTADDNPIEEKSGLFGRFNYSQCTTNQQLYNSSIPIFGSNGLEVGYIYGKKYFTITGLEGSPTGKISQWFYNPSCVFEKAMGGKVSSSNLKAMGPFVMGVPGCQEAGYADDNKIYFPDNSSLYYSDCTPISNEYCTLVDVVMRVRSNDASGYWWDKDGSYQFIPLSKLCYGKVYHDPGCKQLCNPPEGNYYDPDKNMYVREATGEILDLQGSTSLAQPTEDTQKYAFFKEASVQGTMGFRCDRNNNGFYTDNATFVVGGMPIFDIRFIGLIIGITVLFWILSFLRR